tara:strand:- start:310 stop:429 length:120 start_codon:yes stop_codon:yes gene_type:complete
MEYLESIVKELEKANHGGYVSPDYLAEKLASHRKEIEHQ